MSAEDDKIKLLLEYSVPYIPGTAFLGRALEFHRFFGQYDDSQQAQLTDAREKLRALLASLGTFAGAASILDEEILKNQWHALVSSVPDAKYFVDNYAVDPSVSEDARDLVRSIYPRLREAPWLATQKIASIASGLTRIRLEVDQALSPAATWDSNADAYIRAFNVTSLRDYYSKKEYQLREGGTAAQMDTWADLEWSKLVDEIDLNWPGITRGTLRTCGLAVAVAGTVGVITAVIAAAPLAGAAWMAITLAGATLATRPDSPQDAVNAYVSVAKNIKDRLG